MAAISSPFILIITQKDKKKILLTDSFDSPNETTLQLRHVSWQKFHKFEIIDALGNHYICIRAKVIGIDKVVYLRLALIAPILILFGLLFRTLMVRVKLTCDNPPKKVSLNDLKEIVSSAIRENPNYYTFCPPKEIIGRVKKSKTIPTLINSIIKD